MAVNTISTYAAFQSTLSDMSKTQVALTSDQMKMSSGQAAQSFGEMNDQVQQYLSLNNSIARSQQYLNSNKIISSRINTTSSVLGQVIESTNSLMSLISQRRANTMDSSSFSLQLENAWKILANQLNTTLDDQFLFAGAKTGDRPVNPDNFPQTTEAGVPDDGYYHGSDNDLVARPQDNTTMVYNVRANTSGFQKIVAALVAAKKGHEEGNSALLGQAFTLAQEGAREVTSAQATVNSNKVQLINIDQNHQSMQLYWKGLQESIGNADLVSVSTQVAINQGILQASFQTFAKITSLRLSDYLK